MPMTIYRSAGLMDPVQRWIYRIDPKRVNEYGQVLTEDADVAATGGTDSKSKETKKNK